MDQSNYAILLQAMSGAASTIGDQNELPSMLLIPLGVV